MEEGYRGEVWEQMGGWCTTFVAGPYGVSLWKFIRWEWLTFSLYLQFDVGDSSRLKFWHDMWCGDSPLKVVFPKLFNICLNMESSVAELMQLSNGVTHWDVHFSRLVQDWELESLVKFMEPNLFQVGEG